MPFSNCIILEVANFWWNQKLFLVTFIVSLVTLKGYFAKQLISASVTEITFFKFYEVKIYFSISSAYIVN